VEFDDVQRAARTLQLNWWSKQFAGKSVAEITADAVSTARDACGAETFTRGKPRRDKKTGEIIPPKEYRRSGATVNRYIATLSHLFSFAVKERRLIDRNPIGDIRRKKEPRGRTRFLSDEERAALLHACADSEWVPLHALVLLAITTGACRGELVSLKWADVDLRAGRATIHDTKNGEQRTRMGSVPTSGKPRCASGADSSRNTCAATGSPPTRPSAQCGARPGRVSRTPSIAHRSGAIPDISVSACSVLPRESVTEASSQTPERRSSSKPAAR
jgi:hypothetical protein